MIKPPIMAPGTDVRPPKITTGSARNATVANENCTPSLLPQIMPATKATTPATHHTITPYQQYLSGLGIPTSTAFNADANGDGVKEGIKYAFNAASPQLNSTPAAITRTGNTLTYTFDIRNDPALTVVAQLSTNLTSWADQAGSVISNGTGAPTGYIRKIVTITTTEPKAFIRLQVTGN